MDSSVFVTCGDWDIKTMLRRQLSHGDAEGGVDASGKVVAPFDRWLNVKDAFRHYIGPRNYNPSMPDMLKRMRMELEGRHHSGIDDCKNILRIVQKLREEGWDPAKTAPTVLKQSA